MSLCVMARVAVPFSGLSKLHEWSQVSLKKADRLGQGRRTDMAMRAFLIGSATRALRASSFSNSTNPAIPFDSVLQERERRNDEHAGRAEQGENERGRTR